MKNNVSDIDLEKAYRQAAQIVAKHGTKYLPIFERIENEFKQRQKESSLLKRALEIADLEDV